MIRRLLPIFFIGLFTSLQAQQNVEFNDATFPELAVTGRALAMGNAYISKVDDFAAAFYNPAGLGTVRNTHFHFALHSEFNKGWMDAAGGGSFTEAMGDLTKGFSLDGTREILLTKRGVPTNTRFSLMPNFTTRYFSVGYLLSVRQRGYIGNEANADYEYAYRRDHGPYAALNLSLFGGVLKLGVTGILLNRKQVLGTADPNQTIELQDSDYEKGVAGILISGAKITLPFKALPTFSITIHNTADQDFSTTGSQKPEAIRQTMDLGFSITPQIAKRMRLHLELNLRDFGNEYSEISSARKIVAGGELDFNRFLFIRFGYGDGFGSGGLGIKAQKLEFDLTTYAVDLSDTGFQQEEDRRFALSLSWGL